MGVLWSITTAVLSAFLLVACAAVSLGHAQARSAGPVIARLKIVAFGDSLTAGYQLPPKDAFPVQLQIALTERGHDVEILNAGVSGDTAAAGLARLDWAVPSDAAGVLLELGVNDALRGIDPATTRKALQQIITALKARGIEILLAGMQAPHNLGDEYRARFDPIFPELAQANGLLFYPFFMEGVALDPKLTLDDRMHPSAAGVGVIVKNSLPDVEQLIARISARKKS